MKKLYKYSIIDTTDNDTIFENLQSRAQARVHKRFLKDFKKSVDNTIQIVQSTYRLESKKVIR